MKVLGIDPGLSGAAAIYIYEPLRRGWVLIDLPTTGEDTQRRINAVALRNWLTDLDHKPTVAFIELAQVMPSIPGRDGKRREMGASSSFRYGRVAGSIEATVACCGIPITFVAPVTWKRHHGLRGSDKNASRALAAKKFPSMRDHLDRVMDHGRAEAMLIAAYGAHETADPPLLRLLSGSN